VPALFKFHIMPPESLPLSNTAFCITEFFFRMLEDPAILDLSQAAAGRRAVMVRSTRT
jgi:hypothetical protein